MNPRTILFLGHSLIEYYDWEERFPEHNVFNLGIGGETTEGLLSRLPAIKYKHPVADIIFVMTGTNDIAIEDMDFLQSYEKITEKLKEYYPGASVYIHTILPLNVGWLSAELIEEANEEIKKIAERCETGVVDLYHKFVDRDGRPVERYFLDDGVHLSDEGYSVWAQEIERIIGEHP